jgi:hypothetical protein
MDPVVEVSSSSLQELKEAIKYMTAEIKNLKEINETQAGHILRLKLDSKYGLILCMY